MKNMNRKIAALALAGTLATAAHPLGGIVLDPSNLVQNIISASNTAGQLAGIIEQVMTARNTYLQLKESVKKLSSLSSLLPDEISKLLGGLESEAQAYEDYSKYFTERNLSYNGMKFSFADLFKDSAGSGQNGMGDLMGMIRQGLGGGNLADKMEEIISSVSPSQRAKIMEEYGMTPESYVYYKATENEGQKVLEQFYGKLNTKGWAKMRGDNLNAIADILGKVENAAGEMQVLQSIAAMNGVIVNSINTLNENTMQLGAATALQNELNLRKAAAKEKQEAYQRKRSMTSGVMVDSNF